MKKHRIVCVAVWTGLFGVALLRAATPETNKPSAQLSIPYVPTRHDAVRDLLWLADVGTNDVVYDLGSGDGRVVIAAVRDFHARKAVGIEIDPQLLRESRTNAARAGVTDRVEFIQGDLFTNDFSQASVVVLYLAHGANLDLRAKLVRTLKPGARVVSHQFGMGEWLPDKSLDVRTVLLGMYSEMFNPFADNSDVPDSRTPFITQNHDTLSVWIVPAPVAGVWRGKFRMESGEGELTLTLHQRLSGVTGSFQFQGPTNCEGLVQADLWGDHLRCWCISTNRDFYFHSIWFDGHATNDTMTGNLWVPQGKDTREIKWVGRRDKADFTGTWEWTGPMDSLVQLKIERRDGQLAATYVYTNRTVPDFMGGNKPFPVPVTDLYDFDGGFYFTLLLGLEGNSLTGGSRRAGPEDGWLIGEAVVQDNTLKGTISFYPYPDPNAHLPAAVRLRLQLPEWKAVGTAGKRDWLPKRVTR